MIFYPAIDIKEGKCIRLVQGQINKEKIYSTNPIQQAKEFENGGAKWIHVVDIDGAFNGKPRNQNIILEICKSTSAKIQLGGGIRRLETIEFLISKGVQRIVLGTIAITNPEIVKEACEAFPEKIAIGIDSHNSKVAIEGWAKRSTFSEFDIIKKYEDLGVKYFFYTDISKDGLLSGPNIDRLDLILDSTEANVIASGGVSSLNDLKELTGLRKNNLNGVICGKAIYEKKISVPNAISILTKETNC